MKIQRNLAIITTVLILYLGVTGLQAQTVKDIDGNIYHTLTIGTQTWMVENLKTTKYNDGRTIPKITDNAEWETLTTPAYCWYNNDATANKNKYGALYNWYVVNTNEVCPTGWHVPTDNEWATLTPISGGWRYVDGTFHDIKNVSFWWSATESSATSAYYRSVFWDGSDESRDFSNKKDGFSVRCLKDY